MDFHVLLDAPDTPAGRLQIATLGDFTDSRYGDFQITRDDVEQWRTNLAQLPGGRALIDLDHRADRSPRNTEAAGWITGIGWDGDTPMADVEWTPVGERAIRDKRYLFFSPTYGPHKNERGEVFDNTLVGGALTNKPFLGSMPTITLAAEDRVYAAVEAHHSSPQYMLDVSADERKLAVKEGNALSDGSYPIRNTAQLHAAAILAASGHGDVQGARGLIKRRAKELGVDLTSLPGFAKATTDSRRAMDTEILKSLDLDQDADTTKVLEAIQALKANHIPEPAKTLEQQAAENGKVLLDAAKYADLAAGAAAGRQAAADLAEQKFTTAFEKAQRELRATPAQEDNFRALYAATPELALKMLEEAPVILNAKPVGQNVSLDGDGSPEGVHPDSHQLHREVLKRMQAEGPGADYIRTLEQIQAEQKRAA